MRRIKKYKNRRLYDVKEAAYINVADLISLILSGEQIEVRAAKSDEDITQAVLLQALVESGGAELLPADLLHSMVRLSRESPMRSMMLQQLQTSLSLLSLQLESLEKNNPWRQAQKETVKQEGGDISALRARLAALEKQLGTDED